MKSCYIYIYAAAFPSIHTYTHTRPCRKYYYNFFFYFRATWNYWKFLWRNFLLAFCDSSISFVHFGFSVCGKNNFRIKTKTSSIHNGSSNYSWILFIWLFFAKILINSINYNFTHFLELINVFLIFLATFLRRWLIKKNYCFFSFRLDCMTNLVWF